MVMSYYKKDTSTILDIYTNHLSTHNGYLSTLNVSVIDIKIR